MQTKEINYFYQSYFQRVTFKCTQKKVGVKKALPFIKSDFEKKRKLTLKRKGNCFLGVGNRQAWGEGEKVMNPGIEEETGKQWKRWKHSMKEAWKGHPKTYLSDGGFAEL